MNLNVEPYDVYIGRAGKGQSGYFGNPYRVGARCTCGKVHVDAEGVIECFRNYFKKRLRVDHTFWTRVQDLKGKTLGCFCKPGPCHGDVIVEYLEEGCL